MSGNKVDRDLVLQLQAVREFACRLGAAPQAQNDRWESANESDSESRSDPILDPPARASQATRKLFDVDQYSERLSWLKARSHGPEDARAVPIKELEWALAMGPIRKVGSAPSDSTLQEVRQSFPHCLEVIDHVRRRAVLARLVQNAPFRLPPMLLSGPPGVGKTAFSQRLAAVMGVPLVNVDVSTMEASFKLTGLDAGYSTGKPGLIWDALQDACMSPIIVLDELDKVPNGRRSGLGFLLGLLEPSTACRFVDACMDVPIDASHIQWIATCNDASQIDEAVRSRMHEFQIDLPTREQMPAVIESVYRSLRASEPWGAAFDAELSSAVMDALSAHTPRDIWKLLSDACANAAGEGRRVLIPKDLPTGSRQLTGRKMGFV